MGHDEFMTDEFAAGNLTLDGRPELMWWGTATVENVNDGVRLSVHVRPEWSRATAYEAEKEIASGLSGWLDGEPVVVSIDEKVQPPLLTIAADRLAELDPKKLHDFVEVLARAGYNRANQLSDLSGRGDVSAWEADLQKLGDSPSSWKHR
jgi:hypothetical protein